MSLSKDIQQLQGKIISALALHLPIPTKPAIHDAATTTEISSAIKLIRSVDPSVIADALNTIEVVLETIQTSLPNIAPSLLKETQALRRAQIEEAAKSATFSSVAPRKGRAGTGMSAPLPAPMPVADATHDGTTDATDATAVKTRTYIADTKNADARRLQNRARVGHIELAIRAIQTVEFALSKYQTLTERLCTAIEKELNAKTEDKNTFLADRTAIEGALFSSRFHTGQDDVVRKALATLSLVPHLKEKAFTAPTLPQLITIGAKSITAEALNNIQEHFAALKGIQAELTKEIAALTAEKTTLERQGYHHGFTIKSGQSAL